ncbi:MAG TPA: MFS transporter [Ktedonobacterales bacterium]|jgi:MFS family permease
MTTDLIETSGVSEAGQAGNTVAATADASYGALFGVRGFPQLAAGTVLARTAGTLWQVALVLFVLQRFHSPELAGVTAFLSVAPGLAVSPIAGALLDRQGRLRMILVDYAVAAVSLVVLFALTATNHLAPATLLPLVAVSSLTGPLSSSGIRTLFPRAVPRTLWDRANGVDSGSQALATVLGPALAGLLLAAIGGAGTFLATAGLYVVSGVVLIGLHDPPPERGTQPEVALGRSAWQALVFVLRHPTLRGIMFSLSTSNLGFGLLTVALPVLVFSHFHWGTAAVGELWSLSGLITVGAGILAGRVSTEGRERRMVAFGMGVLAAACSVLLLASVAAALLGTVVLIAAMVLIGAGSAPLDVGLFALRQRRTDPAWFGRAVAVSMSLNFAGQPIGSALAGPIVQRSVPLALAVAAILSLLGCVVTYLAIPKAG